VKVTDDDGAVSTASTDVNVQNQDPSASFTSNSPVDTDQDFGLDASGSSDPDGSINSYSWDTDGDGNYGDATGASPSVSKGDDGTYTVGLRVTDNDDDSSTLRKDIEVSNRGPSADFSFTPSSPLTQSTVEFTDESGDPDGSVDSYSWDFGDGSTSSSQNPSHSYSDDGTYTVSLTVTDNDGAVSNTVTKDVTVGNRGPSAGFSFTPSNPDTDESVSFTDQSNDPDGSINSYSWGFGDGSTSSQQNPSHSYSDDGTYTVSLTVTDDDDASSTTSKTVTVSNQGPSASFSSDAPVLTDNDLGLDASSSGDPDGNIDSYSWDTNGDGTYGDATGASPSVSKGDDGTYSIGLKVTDDDGATDTSSQSLTVENRNPSISVTTSTADKTVDIDASGSTDQDGSISSYEYDWTNDGSYEDSGGDLATTSHTYSSGGSKTIKVRVTDNDGGTYSYCNSRDK
jgi:FOG: PKD repeat